MSLAEDQVARPPWWKRQLAWGVLISIALGALSIIVDRGGDAVRFAVVVTLVGIAVTIGIEIRFRLEEIASVRAELTEGQARLQRQLQEFGTYAVAPQSCREFFARIVEDWKRIDERGSVILDWSREDAARDFRARMSELALGRTPVDSRHNFRSHPLQDFAEIRSLNAATTDFWRSARGRRYLEHQQTGITNGDLVVSRIFVLGKEQLEPVAEIVRANAAAGITVSIVLREEIAADPDVPPLRDLSLVTDHSGVAGVFTPGVPGEPEIFTTNQREVRGAEDVLTALEPYLRRIDEIYPGSATA
jgi:hypothetical protein